MRSSGFHGKGVIGVLKGHPSTGKKYAVIDLVFMTVCFCLGT